MDTARLDPPHGGHSFPIPAAPLILLLEARAYAQAAQRDPWEFAVEVGDLRLAGLTPNHLRWLLHQGYVAQALERTQPEADHREFRPVANLSLAEGACFVLTESGVAYARTTQDGQNRQPDSSRGRRPVWDRSRRELRVGGVVVKHFRQPAANQEKLLAAFEEEDWPPRIDDPLPPSPGQEAKKRLQTTIGNLNRGQGGRRVYFGGGGDGQSVCWSLVAANGERGESEGGASVAGGAVPG